MDLADLLLVIITLRFLINITTCSLGVCNLNSKLKLKQTKAPLVLAPRQSRESCTLCLIS